MKAEEGQKSIEEAEVALPDTLPSPWTVVIKAHDAAVAIVAVDRAHRPCDIALATVTAAGATAHRWDL